MHQLQKVEWEKNGKQKNIFSQVDWEKLIDT